MRAKSPSTQRKGSDAKQRPLDLLNSTVTYAINRAEVRVYQALDRRLPDELSPARLATLAIVEGSPGMTQAALGAALGVASPTVVKLVNALEELGYMKRRAIDRRSYGLTLTELGEAQLALCIEITKECEKATTRGLSAAEKQTLMALLDRISNDAG